MSRTPLPYSASDISALARSLRAHLAGREEPPGHVELLNILAKATGYRNFQHFRAQAAAQDHLAQRITEPAPSVDHLRVVKVARCFDEAGRLARWPAKFGDQKTCLWVLWSRMPANRVMIEEQVNRLLRDNHRFGDHALLRREMCDLGLLSRTPDGREYRRVERSPPDEELALIRHLKPRLPGATGVERSRP